MANVLKGLMNRLGLREKGASKKPKSIDTLGSNQDDPLADPLSKKVQDDIEPQWKENPIYGKQLPKEIAKDAPPPQQPQGPSNAFSEVAGQKAQERRLKNLFARSGGKKLVEDRHVGEVVSQPNDVSQSAHEVQRVNLKRQIGDTGTNEGFFKPASDEFHGSADGEKAGIGKFQWNNELRRDETIESPQLIARSMASTRLDKKLGTDIIAHEYQANIGGKQGVISGKTDGVSLKQLDPNYDMSNPTTQRGLSDLQLFDYLSGQVDRHEGNIFVDPKSGKVKGIDNDLAWGTNNKVLDNDGANNFGLPQNIHKDTAKKFLKMKESDLMKIVGGRSKDMQNLGPEEQEAAVERLRTIKSYLKGEEVDGRQANIVKEFDKDTYDRSIQSIPTNDKEGKKIDYGFGRQRSRHLPGYLERATKLKEMTGRWAG